MAFVQSFSLIPTIPVIEDVAREIGVFANPKIDWERRPLAGKPVTSLTETLAVLGVYLMVVIYAIIARPASKPASGEGKKEKSTLLKLAMIVYNTTQVLLCGWMAAMAYQEMEKQEFEVICPPAQSYDSQDVMVIALYIFFVSKVLDMLDTVFMVAGAKWEQVTFLHVYHHITIFLFYWLNSQVAWGGPQAWPVFANSVIHFVMYLYYLLSVLGIQFLPGALVTILQMTQFVSMIAQGTMVWLRSDECPFPKRVALAYVIYIASLLILFLDFFIRKHFGKPKAKTS